MTLFIRPYSDLHMEFMDFELPYLETDKDDILILAGDISVIDAPKTFDRVKEWLGHFRKVIHLNGNHEFYRGSLIYAPQKLKIKIFKDFLDANVGVNNQVIRVENVSFICATLWTNFNNANPVDMQTVRSALNDYRFIHTGNLSTPYLRKINPDDILREFIISKKFIFESIREEKHIHKQKVVVITHHAPCLRSIHARFKGDPVNWGYVSDLELEIMDTEPDFWIHGHVHNSFDYMVQKTRLIANPRGYCQKISRGYTSLPILVNENPDFNPTLRIEV